MDDDLQQRVLACDPDANPGHTRTPIDHFVRWIRDAQDSLVELETYGAPPIIVTHRRELFEESVRVAMAFRDAGRPQFAPSDEDGPIVVVDPPRDNVFHSGDPDDVLAVAFVADGLVLQFPSALAHLTHDDIAIQPFGTADLACSQGGGARLLFRLGGPKHAVYDSRERRWLDNLEAFPDVHVSSLVSLSTQLVSLSTGEVATLPGTRCGEAMDFVLSPDGRWLWTRMTPEADDFGVLEVEVGAPRFNPWRDRVKALADRDLEDWHDPSTRAVVMHGTTPRFFHAGVVMQDATETARLAPGASAAAFDEGGEQLALVDGTDLVVARLHESGSIVERTTRDLSELFSQIRVNRNIAIS